MTTPATRGVGLLKGLYDRPGDEGQWADLVEHYSERVRGWIWRLRRRPQEVDEVYSEFWMRLHRALTGPNRRPLDASRTSNGPYFRKAILHICRDMFGDGGRWAVDARRGDRAAEELVDLLIEEEEREEAAGRYAREVDEFAGDYGAALKELKRDPQYDPRSFALFLGRYRDEAKAKELDEARKFKGRDSSGQGARRVLRRLIGLMGLPADPPEQKAASEAIVKALVRKYGDASP